MWTGMCSGDTVDLVLGTVTREEEQYVAPPCSIYFYFYFFGGAGLHACRNCTVLTGGYDDAFTDVQTNSLILSCLELLQGLLLLHPQSRQLFAREIHMNVSSY